MWIQVSAVKLEHLMMSESELHHSVKPMFKEVGAPQKLIVDGVNPRFYGKNKTRGANQTEWLGRCLGPAHAKGNVMSQHVLKERTLKVE